jgi:hypothetical protein
MNGLVIMLAAQPHDLGLDGGGDPVGAQVRRTGGRSDTPDSSRKQSQAPRLSAPR